MNEEWRDIKIAFGEDAGRLILLFENAELMRYVDGSFGVDLGDFNATTAHTIKAVFDHQTTQLVVMFAPNN